MLDRALRKLSRRRLARRAGQREAEVGGKRP
jgi:hypothetical protein